MKVLIVIPNFNGKKYLEKLLPRIEELEIPKDCEVWKMIIDMGSTDNSREFIKEFIKDKRNWIYIETKDIGGSGGFFLGYVYAIKNNFDFVWFLDNDAYPTKDTLKILLNIAAKYKLFYLNPVNVYKGKIVSAGEFFIPWKCNVYVNKKGEVYKKINKLFKTDIIFFNSCFIKPIQDYYIDLNYFLKWDDWDFSLQIKENKFFIGNTYIEHPEFLLPKLNILVGIVATRNSFYIIFKFYKRVLWLYILYKFLSAIKSSLFHKRLLLKSYFLFLIGHFSKPLKIIINRLKNIYLSILNTYYYIYKIKNLQSWEKRIYITEGEKFTNVFNNNIKVYTIQMQSKYQLKKEKKLLFLLYRFLFEYKVSTIMSPMELHEDLKGFIYYNKDDKVYYFYKPKFKLKVITILYSIFLLLFVPLALLLPYLLFWKINRKIKMAKEIHYKAITAERFEDVVKMVERYVLIDSKK